MTTIALNDSRQTTGSMNTELTTTAVDFDRELENFTQNMAVNCGALQRVLANITLEMSDLGHVNMDAISKSAGWLVT